MFQNPSICFCRTLNQQNNRSPDWHRNQCNYCPEHDIVIFIPKFNEHKNNPFSYLWVAFLRPILKLYHLLQHLSTLIIILIMQYHPVYSTILSKKGCAGMVADRIRHLREQNGWTQSALAKILGITRSSVNAWEMGISVPSTQYVVELSSLFKVSTDYLLCVDKTISVSLDGLSQEDIQLVHSIVNHLRNKNTYTI